MYCSNCGKFIDYDAKLCKECEAELFAPKAPDGGATDTETPPVTDSTTPTTDQVPPTTDQVPPTTDQVPPHDGGMPPYGYYYNPNFYQPPTNPYAYSTEPEPHNLMFGFGKALASVILGFVAYLVALFSIFFIAETSTPAGGFFILLLAAALTVCSLVFAIQSIRCFIRRKSTCRKPIPALVLGIAGIEMASMGAFAVFFMSLVLLLISIV